MERQTSTIRGSLLGGSARPPVQPPCTLDPTRAFPDFAQRIAVAQAAAQAASETLTELRLRLGIQNEFGQTADIATECEPSGEVHATQMAIDRLTDTVRDLRGIAETLNGRL